MAVSDELNRLIRPAIEAMGFEFVGLEYLSNPKNRLVRIYIDREPDGIDVEDCAAVSNEVSALLDVEDPVSGQYSLEVSSPGIERPLFEPAHFRRFIGEPAVVLLHAPVEGRRKLVGPIVEADESGATIDVDGTRFSVSYDEVRRAHLKPDMDALLSGKG
jgi:ribosome maturation factor RimP